MLIFKTPLPGSRNKGKIESLLKAFEPFLKPRHYFGETIRVMPELNEDEQRYLELHDKNKALKEQRNTFESMASWLSSPPHDQYEYHRHQLPEGIRDEWKQGRATILIC